jgi:hypothetical protein
MTAIGTCSIALDPGPGLCVMTGSANPPTLVGMPNKPFALLVKMTSSGALGTAAYSWSTDAGAHWSTPVATQSPTVVANGETYSLGSTGRENPVGDGLGLNARFVDATFSTGDQWSFALPTLAGTPTASGSDLALAIGTAEIPPEWARLIEEKSGCPLLDPDEDNSGAITGWLALAQRRFDALAQRAVGLAGAIIDVGGGGGGTPGATGATGATGAAGSGSGIQVGPLASLPDPATLPDGTMYVPTDDATQLIDISSHWNMLIPGSVPIAMSVGDISGWTYESGITAGAVLEAIGGYSRMRSLLSNPSPDYIDWLASDSTLHTGAGGIWTITLCTKYRPTVARSGEGNPYSSVNIVLLDGSGHRFMFGPQDGTSGPLTLSAATAGFTNHTRNYYGGINANNLHTTNGITWVRLRYDGTNYISEYSVDGSTWILTTAGGTNIFNWGSGAITPTNWGIGTQYIPGSLGTWDIYQLEQTPT